MEAQCLSFFSVFVQEAWRTSAVAFYAVVEVVVPLHTVLPFLPQQDTIRIFHEADEPSDTWASLASSCAVGRLLLAREPWAQPVSNDEAAIARVLHLSIDLHVENHIVVVD